MLSEGRGSGGHLEGPWQQTILFDTQHPTLFGSSFTRQIF